MIPCCNRQLNSIIILDLSLRVFFSINISFFSLSGFLFQISLDYIVKYIVEYYRAAANNTIIFIPFNQCRLEFLVFFLSVYDISVT
jgi:hypothetical protein